jgi:hypothetical protein
MARKAPRSEPKSRRPTAVLRVTILDKISADGTNCEAEHPGFLPGDSFVLEGGRVFDPGHSSCNPVRGARYASPWFLTL